MNAAAVAVCREVGSDIVVAYGVSDEYSFVLSKGCELFERRARFVPISMRFLAVFFDK